MLLSERKIHQIIFFCFLVQNIIHAQYTHIDAAADEGTQVYHPISNQTSNIKRAFFITSPLIPTHIVDVRALKCVIQYQIKHC